MGSKKAIKPEVAMQAMEFYLTLFHPNFHRYKLDELTRYVFKYCHHWMTDEEQRATQYLAFCFSAESSTAQRGQKFWLNQAKKLWDAQIEAMLENGEEAFLYQVRDRIRKDNGDKLFNLCPRCGALARTDQAKQCPKCSYDWHEQV